MPLYEYRCQRCGFVTEVLQKLSDPPLRRCSVCKGKTEKMISRTSFQLKGGGWYTEGYGKSASESSASETAASSDSPASSDAKPPAQKAQKKEKEKAEPKAKGNSQ
jgi:putative FmdB family regulatory protein